MDLLIPDTQPAQAVPDGGPNPGWPADIDLSLSKVGDQLHQDVWPELIGMVSPAMLAEQVLNSKLRMLGQAVQLVAENDVPLAPAAVEKAYVDAFPEHLLRQCPQRRDADASGYQQDPGMESATFREFDLTPENWSI